MLTKEKLEELSGAMQCTWDVIAADVAETGGKLTRLQAAEVCADYVYAYGVRHDTAKSKELSDQIMALADDDFRRLAKHANLCL